MEPTQQGTDRSPERSNPRRCLVPPPTPASRQTEHLQFRKQLQQQLQFQIQIQQLQFQQQYQLPQPGQSPPVQPTRSHCAVLIENESAATDVKALCALAERDLK
ncbi:hypothetical protein PI124_g4057 [Phytophthora idaei]|nr:hypothetical protein PI125_g2026 [Phytophthora idaei]KAG3251339.1 hypothetical protein PI124_g4057 [Phytophthora idaei]